MPGFAAELAVKALREEAEKRLQRAMAKKAAESLAVRKAAAEQARAKLIPRKVDQTRAQGLTVRKTARAAPPKPSLSIFDMEGKPFVTSMADMSQGAHDITHVGGTELAAPVRLLGGQDYMADAPGSVWANDAGSVSKHMALAAKLKRETGEDPFFMPWTMGPTAINFNHMPRELMARYADATLGKRAKNQLTKNIRQHVPGFEALDDPESMRALITSSARTPLNKVLDLARDEGGMPMGVARLLTTDEDQLATPWTGLRNVGRIAADAAPEMSAHASFPMSVPGVMEGRLKEPVAAYDLLPELAAKTGVEDPWRLPPGGVRKGEPQPARVLQMKPYGGVITHDILRALEERLKDRYAKGGLVEQPDYDYAGAERAGVEPDERGHMPDTYKLPNHMTFSDDSVYSKPGHEGGKWRQGTDGRWGFWASPENLRQHSVPEMQSYFAQVEPDSFAVYPSDYRLR